MKYTILLILLFSCFQLSAQEDYTIYINGTELKVALDKNYETVINGKKVSFSIKANDTLTYVDDVLSFKYPKGLTASKTQLDGGIEQIAILNASGSGIIIQKYASLDPSPIKEFILNEMTKESIGYGYASKKTEYKRTLASGSSIDILKATLSYKDETNVYEIASLGKKDEGILVMTLNMNDGEDTVGQGLIDLMWKTIKVK